MKKHSLISKTVLFSLLGLILTVVSGCSSSQEIMSTYQDNEIKIDGNISDWGKSIQKIPDNNFSLGFKNDDKFLYVALLTEDRFKIFQMFRAGFIVWFEPESNDFKTFGVKYPIAKELNGEMQMPEQNAEGMGREDMRGERSREEMSDGVDRKPGEGMMERLLITQNEFEIVNKDKYPLIALPLINKEGIEAKLAFHQNRFVYELKIPLADNKQYSFAAGALPGGKIKIRFETEQVERAKSNEDRGGMRMSGGGEEPGEGGGMSGSGRGARREGMRAGSRAGSRMAPLNYTVELSLEKQPVK